MSVRLGIGLPTHQPDGSASTITQVMARAHLIEQIGFDGIWIGESVGRGDIGRPDTLLWLTAAAAATQRIELGTAILQVPLRHPVEFAQRLMTLYALSNGRFVAGLGAGSTKADFDAVGLDWEQRFRLFNQGVATIKRLLNGETVGTANLHPWPNVVGGPPILIGSWESGTWVQRAAQEYDGWMGSGLTSYNALKEGIRRFRDAGGKRAMAVTIGIDLKAPRTPLKDDERFRLYCGPEEAAERLQRLADLGYDDICLSSINHTEADITEEDLVTIRGLVKK